MKPCTSCAQQNQDDANFCLRCGTPFAPAETSSEEPQAAPSDAHAAAASEAPPDSEPLDEARLWRAFIGPNADRYLEQFKKFSGSPGPMPRYAVTWHWPAFLFDPFLWFLYRKMYLYALVYALGPVLSAYFTGDFTVGIVWRIIAGVSANYIYFWHIKEQLAGITQRAGADRQELDLALKDEGGVQPYVIGVGVVLHLLMLGLLVKAIQEGPPDGNPLQPRKVAPAPSRDGA